MAKVKADRNGGFPHLLVISASAGSGKTEALARRYLRLALSDDAPYRDIGNILAITFTRLAVREMKERMLDLLKKLALGLDRDLEKDMAGELGIGPAKVADRAAGLLDSIIARYSDFQVATIDSFNSRLVGAAAVELDLAPQSTLTMEYGELVSLALDSMLGDMAGKPEVDEAVREFVGLLNDQPYETFAWRPALKLEEAFLRFLSYESKLQGGLVFGDTGAEMGRAFSSMEKAVESMARTAEKAGMALKHFDTLAGAVRERDMQTLSRRKLDADNPPCYARDRGKTAAADIAREWARLPELRAAAAEARANGYYHPYGRCFRMFRGYLERAKGRTGTIHIDDMARMLARLLGQGGIPDIYLRLGARLRHFLLDEFQDTDPQQWRALRPLLDEALSGGGSLFLVGDLKQAIYQFREADYRIMRGLVREIKGEEAGGSVPASVRGRAEVRELPLNRRSGGVIVDYAARVFRDRLPRLIASGAFGPDVTGLTSYTQVSHPSLQGRGLVRTRRCPPGVDRDEWTRDQVIGALNEARDRGYGYGRMAVLAPRNDDLGKVVAWLAEAGIPAASSGSLDVRERKAASELASLLRFLDSPVDDLAFAEFVSGDVFRLSAVKGEGAFGSGDLAEAALQARRQGRWLYRAFRDSAKGSVIWQEKFEGLYQKVGHYPLYDLLSLACETFGVWQNMPQESAALLKMLDAANRLAEEGRNGVRDFLELWDGSSGEEFSLELPGYVESVRALTVHAAKGLGFPVVVNIIRGRPSSGPEVRRRDGEDLMLLYVPGYLAQCSETLARDLGREEAEADVQFLNGLYVSCTRARHELHNLVLTEGDADPLAELFPGEELGAAERAKLGPESVPVPWSPQSHGGPGYPGEETRWSRMASEEAERGIRLHRALESIEFLEGTPAETAAAAVRRAELRHGAMPDAERVANVLAGFLSRPEAASGFVRAPGREVLREAEFADADGRLYRVDRLVLEPGSVELWEFKSGRPGDHRGQMESYRRLLSECYPGREVRLKLAYIEDGRVEEVA